MGVKQTSTAGTIGIESAAAVETVAAGYLSLAIRKSHHTMYCSAWQGLLHATSTNVVDVQNLPRIIQFNSEKKLRVLMKLCIHREPQPIVLLILLLP